MASSNTHENGYVSESSGNSGLSVNIHPLPLLNISDVYNRAKLTSSSTKLIGALLGTESNREISIVNSFELIFANPDDDVDMSGTEGGAGAGASTSISPGQQIHAEFFATRQDQYKQVFPTLSVVGWYTVGTAPTAEDVALHHQFGEVASLDTPIFLLFNPNIEMGSQALPVNVYESALDSGIEGEASKFVELDYGVETGEAERIAVDGVSKGMGGEGEESALVASLTTQRNAIRMLYQRIQVLLEYVTSVIQKNAKPDHTILRQISALVATLPTMDAKEFRNELDTEYNDIQLGAYLTVLTKRLSALNDYADKHNLLHPPVSDDFSGPRGTSRGFDMGAGGWMGGGTAGGAGGVGGRRRK